MPRQDGVSDSGPGGCEFETRLRRNFFPAYFRLFISAEACEKSSRRLWKENCVSTSVRKPVNTYVRHRPPRYELSCLIGVKPQYN